MYRKPGGIAAVAPDASLGAWATSNGVLQITETVPRKVSSLQVGAAQSLAIGPNAKLILVGSDDRTVHIWDYSKREKIGALTGLPAAAAKLCITVAVTAVCSKGESTSTSGVSGCRSRRRTS